MDRGEIVEFDLRRESFGEADRMTARDGALRASTFRFDTGVEAFRVDKRKGNVRILPARASARFVTRLG